MPSFGGANALNYAIGFKVCKVLLYRFCRDAHLAGKRNGTQLAIFGKQGDDFLPTFHRFLPTFLQIVTSGRKYGKDDGVSHIRKTDNQEVVDENSCTFVGKWNR